MTSYIVMLPGDEAAWAQTPQDERQRVYARHEAFQKALAERGHTMTGGAELRPSSEARVVRTSADGEQTITEGPYSESVEQLTGFYLIDSDDLDDLLAVIGSTLGPAEGAVEVRAFVGGEA